MCKHVFVCMYKGYIYLIKLLKGSTSQPLSLKERQYLYANVIHHVHNLYLIVIVPIFKWKKDQRYIKLNSLISDNVSLKAHILMKAAISLSFYSLFSSYDRHWNIDISIKVGKVTLKVKVQRWQQEVYCFDKSWAILWWKNNHNMFSRKNSTLQILKLLQPCCRLASGQFLSPLTYYVDGWEFPDKT